MHLKLLHDVTTHQVLAQHRTAVTDPGTRSSREAYFCPHNASDWHDPATSGRCADS